MKSPYLTVAEAAEELKVSTETIYRLCRSKKLAVLRIGSQWRISRRDLENATSRPAVGWFGPRD